MEKQAGLTFAIAALGIIGTLLGSGMQHFLSVQRDKSREFEDRRREAYVQFLGTVDKSRVARDMKAKAELLLENSKKKDVTADQAETLRKEALGLQQQAEQLERVFQMEGGAAVRLIAVYGDKEVVESYALFSRTADKQEKETDGHYDYATCAPTWREDVAMYQAIRISLLGPDQAVTPFVLAHSALLCNPGEEQ